MKIFQIMLIFLLVMSIVNAVPVAIVSNIEPNDISSLFEEKYITGGTLSNGGRVFKTEILDATLNVKFTKKAVRDSQGYSYKIELYFIDDVTKQTKLIRTFKFTQEHAVGDWINVNVRGLDTSILPDSFCNKGVKIGGMHLVYTGTGWEEDNLPSITWESNGAAVYRTGENFIFICANVAECTNKVLRTECFDDGANGAIATITQSSYLDANGNCGEERELDYCLSGQTCVNAQCITKSVCSDGERKCDQAGKISLLCENGQYSSTDMSTWHICMSGACDESTGDCITDGETGGLGCTADTQCNNNQYCNKVLSTCQTKEQTGNNNQVECLSCTKDYICADGKTIFMNCKEGCLVSNDAVSTCPSGKTCSGNNDCVVENSAVVYICDDNKCTASSSGVDCKKYEELIGTKCEFSTSNLWDNYKNYIVVIVGLAVVAIMILLYLLFVRN